MKKIEQSKSYKGSELESTIFAPMLTGPSAEELGVKVMYNMPVPTMLQFWQRAGDVLHRFEKNGWKGGKSATKFQKKIDLHRVKAEVGYKAEDYYNMVYQQIVNSAKVNMGDLTGTELEKAETALFREAVGESIRATMWVGDRSRTGNKQFSTFDGFIKQIIYATFEESIGIHKYEKIDEGFSGEDLLQTVWEKAYQELKDCKSQGNLVYLVTSDVYASYEYSLDNVMLESAYIAKQEGRKELSYRGIPVIDLQISQYMSLFDDMPSSFGLLTDRRNLALAVNTADFPGTEVNMWYNPDEMENRQRAVFMAGCNFLLPELISIGWAD